ncbi:hypothetical protein LTR65_008068 [Meristemomyces frigidus]
MQGNTQSPPFEPFDLVWKPAEFIARQGPKPTNYYGILNRILVYHRDRTLLVRYQPTVARKFHGCGLDDWSTPVDLWLANERSLRDDLTMYNRLEDLIKQHLGLTLGLDCNDDMLLYQGDTHHLKPRPHEVLGDDTSHRIILTVLRVEILPSVASHPVADKSIWRECQWLHRDQIKGMEREEGHHRLLTNLQINSHAMVMTPVLDQEADVEMADDSAGSRPIGDSDNDADDERQRTE